MKRASRVSGVFWRAAVVAAAIAALPFQGHAQATDGRLTIGTSKTGILIWLADANGYFAEQDVTVDVVEVGSGVVAAEQVHDGILTFGTSSEFAFTTKIMEEPGLCIYGTVSATSTTRLIARADRVSQDPIDLVGKRIAVTRGGIGEYFLDQYLTLAGLSYGQAELVPASPTEIVDKIAAGDVDAAMAWEPYVTRIRRALRGKVLEYPDQADQYYYFVLHGRCDLSPAGATALPGVLRALIRAEHFARDEADQAMAVLSARLGMPIEAVREVWPQHSLAATLTQDLLAAIESEAAWRIERGLSGGPIPNTLEVVRTGPLRAISPGAVQIIN